MLTQLVARAQHVEHFFAQPSKDKRKINFLKKFKNNAKKYLRYEKRLARLITSNNSYGDRNEPLGPRTFLGTIY